MSDVVENKEPKDTKKELSKKDATKEPKETVDEVAKEGADASKPTGARKSKKNVATGRAYVLSTFNNTVITFTDVMGNTLAWCSAGAKGFAGSRKNTPFAAQVAAEDAAKKAADCGVRSVQVFVSGPGGGRESAIRAIAGAGIRVTYIEDTTPIPHNGCRPPKRRRV
jgi:small subunit ribosomal protein S11